MIRTPTSAKPTSYYAGCNEALLRAVPKSVGKVLDVGCGLGHFGASLKAQDDHRLVYGIEREPAVAASAAARLDRVFTLDVQYEDPPLEPGSIDCIVFGDVLEHLVSPEDVLLRYRRFLGPNGIVLCSVPNVQHHSLVAALFKGDFQYTTSGLLDATHLRFFTYSTFIKLLLDAGFVPEIVDAIRAPAHPEFFKAAEPLFHYLGLHADRTAHYFSAYQYIFRATLLPGFQAQNYTPCPQPFADEKAGRPLTFVACVSDEETLRANLLASPCLAAGSPHEVLLARSCPSAAHGLNGALARARNPVVICVHQDVYLPDGWVERFWERYEQAERQFGKLGVVGVYGVTYRKGRVHRAGHVIDRDRLLREEASLPAVVDTLDELLLAVPRAASLRLDPGLGFHLYGADLCLAAQAKGLATVAVDALCFHNSPHVGLPAAFHQSAQAFATKWKHRLPMATSCVLIHPQGRITLT